MWIAEAVGWHSASNIGYLIARYGHIVAAMVLIGGLMFQEMVVPLALSDEREENRLALFARTRWSFRRIVWGCLLLSLLSGAVMSYHRVPVYLQQEYSAGEIEGGFAHALPIGLRTGWWWVAHVSTGVMAMMIALYVIAGDRPIAHPISWLRLDLVMLLVVVFLGSVTHYVDMVHIQRALGGTTPPVRYYIAMPERPAAAPTTDRTAPDHP
jgi:hypothetical protein